MHKPLILIYWSFHGVIIFIRGMTRKFLLKMMDLIYYGFPRPIPITITLKPIVFLCYLCYIIGAVAFYFPQFFSLFFFYSSLQGLFLILLFSYYYLFCFFLQNLVFPSSLLFVILYFQQFYKFSFSL